MKSSRLLRINDIVFEPEIFISEDILRQPIGKNITIMKKSSKLLLDPPSGLTAKKIGQINGLLMPACRRCDRYRPLAGGRHGE